MFEAIRLAVLSCRIDDRIREPARDPSESGSGRIPEHTHCTRKLSIAPRAESRANR